MSHWSTAPETDASGLPLPCPTALSRPHWDGCARGELLVQCCADCGRRVFPPQPVCTACFSERVGWERSSGRGLIYSFTVVHRPPRPEFEVPYVIVIVELEEGWHMLSNLLDCDPDAVAVGDPVEVSFETRAGMVLPMFRRRGA